ncbi:MAG: clostripain-related cysteine peptidase [Myxococcota bacterium]|nr:clostripain-related cysteine peptidase [Myxococcota bacterium]
MTAACGLTACSGASVDPLQRNGGDNRAQGDGIGGDSDPTTLIDTPENTHSSGGTAWTVLVYMVADNDLEPFALLDLAEMMRVGRNDNFTIVLQIDRAIGFTEAPIGMMPNWTGTMRVRVENGKLTELDDLGEKNMGDPTVLADFLSWGINTYPADNIALVFWDHGSAWPGFGADMSAAYDGLTMAELATGMAAGLAGAQRDRVALVGFDACLMGSLETALVLRDYAEYMLASEELEPGHGWDYESFAAALDDGTISPVELSQEVMQGFRSQAILENTSANITLSLVDLYNLKAVERALNAMTSVFDPTVASLVTLFGRARAEALEFGRQASDADSALMVDLAGVASTMADAGGPIAVTANNLIDAVQAAVLNRTSGSATATATGISVYWPPYRTLYDDAYDNVPAIGIWRTLLTAVQEAGASNTNAPTFVSPTAAMSATAGGVRLTGNLATGTQTSVVAEGMYYGLKIDGQYIALGDTFGSLAGMTVSADWDRTALVVSQGSLAEYTYFSYQPGANGTFVATIPFGYAANSSQQDLDTALLVIVYDSAGNVQQQTFYLSTAAGYGQLTPAAGSQLFAVWAELDGDEMLWGASDTVFNPNQDFSLDLQPLSTTPANTTAFGVLYAQDYAGQEAQCSWEGEL